MKPTKEINFTTKPPELKSLPNEVEEVPTGIVPFLKKAGAGLGRTMCLPLTTTVIAGCGFLAFLAFLLKIPTAAFLEQIGLKELAKELTSDEEIDFFEKVAKSAWNQGVMKIGEDFGEAARSLRTIATAPLEDISIHEEEIDNSTLLTKNSIEKGRPETSPYDPVGIKFRQINKISRRI